jgi:hypothetical protein
MPYQIAGTKAEIGDWPADYSCTGAPTCFTTFTQAFVRDQIKPIGEWNTMDNHHGVGPTPLCLLNEVKVTDFTKGNGTAKHPGSIDTLTEVGRQEFRLYCACKIIPAFFFFFQDVYFQEVSITPLSK